MENIDESSKENTLIEQGFMVLRYENENKKVLQKKMLITREYIQFHFCLKGAGKLLFNNGNYEFQIKEEHAVLLYNPTQDLPLNLNLEPNSWIVSVIISISKFHSLFSNDADHIFFLNPENSKRKFYDDNIFPPNIAVVLSQILQAKVHDSMRALYFKGKVYELLSLYFNKSDDTDLEQCPFLVDEENVRKIRHAKEIILERMSEPPTLHELSQEIGLSLKKLKEGFKQLYGDTVYGYLLEHKMTEAQRMLESKSYNVNEVGLRLGYSTASHFIVAFKKKYGTTPKKYLMSVSS
ncbi:MAG: AraC family transcriptional activator of pyochelin receptor [Candidatus Marivariicella framensis]|jgi:AraC family transcriptional activator of pyochelin receptor|tara:strand:- start:992 stop:1873 length:882 start_codon:yes stop_codon:yes gene_type:complete